MRAGVLYHESDLDLEAHYTDTHGYTETNFAAFGMVGMPFCPSQNDAAPLRSRLGGEYCMAGWAPDRVGGKKTGSGCGTVADCNLGAYRQHIAT